jgi:hypothetical protein
MAEIIDEDGNLFGVVNIIDALVVLLVVAVLGGGVSLVLSSPTSQDTTEPDGPNLTVVDIEYQSANLQPYVVDAISEGAVPSENVSQIHNKSVTASQVVTQNQSGALLVQQHPVNQTVTLRIGLRVTGQDGEYLYNGQPLEIGSELTLDLGETTVTGNIVAVDPSDSA